MPEVTVFVATYNRLETLSRTVESLLRMKTPLEIVIVDNGTDDPLCLNLLQQLQKDEKVRYVIKMGKVDWTSEVASHFTLAFRKWADYTTSAWFAVTDADVCFEGSSLHSLDAYISLAQETDQAVGPSLRVTGLPHGYPLRSRVIATESRTVFKDRMQWINGIPFFRCMIDTTFQLFPRTDTYKWRGMNFARVGPPYDAKHLDWHIDVFNPALGDIIYMDTASSAAGWGATWIRSLYKAYQEDPEAAYQEQLQATWQLNDLCNTRFALSWFNQYGLQQPDVAKSEQMLYGAIPTWFEEIWARQKDWIRMIYQDDYTPLGW